MSPLNTNWLMAGLDILMIAYTLWVVSPVNSPDSRKKPLWRIGTALLIWLVLLHTGLSNQVIFAEDISGVSFLSVIFAAVGATGILLLGISAVRKILFDMSQAQLLLMQGIRVFFGAIFLTQASLHLCRFSGSDCRIYADAEPLRNKICMVCQSVWAGRYSDCGQYTVTVYS